MCFNNVSIYIIAIHSYIFDYHSVCMKEDHIHFTAHVRRASSPIIKIWVSSFWKKKNCSYKEMKQKTAL